jgi:hypothetical protein
VVQQRLEKPLAQDILSGKFGSGDLVNAMLKQDQMQFEKG